MILDLVIPPRSQIDALSTMPIASAPEPTTSERLTEAWQHLWQSGASVSANMNRDRALAAVMDEFYAKAGRRLQYPVQQLAAKGIKAATPDDVGEALVPEIQAWNDSQTDPAKKVTLPTRTYLDDADTNAARAADARQQDIANRTTTRLGKVQSFGINAAVPLADPRNLALLPFGAGSGGILRTALTEAALGAAGTGMIEVTDYRRRKEIDPGYTVGDAALNVAESGLAAGVLGGAFRGGYLGGKALLRRWRTDPPPLPPGGLRDAFNVADREDQITHDAPVPGGVGAAEHVAAMRMAEGAVVDGQPLSTLPAEMVPSGGWRINRRWTAGMETVPVRWEVVDAPSLITSNRPDFTVNPDFPPALQPRERDRPAMQAQVVQMASRLEPDLLGFDARVDGGAPTIGPDNVVESGNGRVMAIRRAYASVPAAARRYRDRLESLGFDTTGMREPVLVARRLSDMTPEQRAAFATGANQATAATLSAPEQARADARMLDRSLLARWQDAGIGTRANADFVRGFMERLPPAERSRLVDKDGALSVEGQRRIKAALVARAVDDPAFLSRALEDTDSNVRALAGAVEDAAGPWAAMRDDALAGRIAPGMDITRSLEAAIAMVMRARDQGVDIETLVHQGALFGDGPDQMTRVLLRSFFGDDLKRPASRAKVAAVLKEFATEARKSDAGPSLVGEPVKPDEVMGTALRKANRADLADMLATVPAETIDKAKTAPDTLQTAAQEFNRRHELGELPRSMKVTRLDEAGAPQTVDVNPAVLAKRLDEDEFLAGELLSCATGMRPAA